MYLYLHMLCTCVHLYVPLFTYYILTCGCLNVLVFMYTLYIPILSFIDWCCDKTWHKRYYNDMYIHELILICTYTWMYLYLYVLVYVPVCIFVYLCVPYSLICTCIYMCLFYQMQWIDMAPEILSQWLNPWKHSSYLRI